MSSKAEFALCRGTGIPNAVFSRQTAVTPTFSPDDRLKTRLDICKSRALPHGLGSRCFNTEGDAARFHVR
jgi:hypothetical protein